MNYGRICFLALWLIPVSVVAELLSPETGCFAALHTLPSPVRGARREDLWWSLGVETADAGSGIVMLSGPVGYNRRRSVVKALQQKAMSYGNAYVTLYPGQIVEKTFWIGTGVATPDAFGFEQALDVSLDLFRPYDAERFEKFGRIVASKRRFALSRWVEVRICAARAGSWRVRSGDHILGEKPSVAIENIQRGTTVIPPMG